MSQQLLVSDIEYCLVELASTLEARLDFTFDESEQTRRIYAGNHFDNKRAEDRRQLLDYLVCVGNATRSTHLRYDGNRAVGRQLVYRVTDQGKTIAKRVMEDGGPNWDDETTVGFINSGESFRDGVSERISRVEWGSPVAA